LTLLSKFQHPEVKQLAHSKDSLVSTFQVEAHNLSKKFTKGKNGILAVEDFSFAVPAGQMFGLLGPDGAGKTTTLRMLASVMPATKGNAKVGGFDTQRETRQARQLIGYMPQNFSLYPDLSVMENLIFFADINGVHGKRRNERIQEMLAFTRLKEFTDRRAANLSGGMKKKLALACALLHEPQVLILDEPSTGVDPVSRRELWVILSKVVQDGVTIVVSTPYMDEAERCHQVGILYNGKLLTSGSPSDLQNGLPFEIVEVKAKPRKVMREVVGDAPYVLQWRTIGDRLRLSVKDPFTATTLLENTLTSEGAEIKVLRHSKRSMEDVFIHLVEERRASN
jgi:ABC-2 type transport system ATP-binding protein